MCINVILEKRFWSVMRDIIKPPVLVIDGMKKKDVMKKAIVTSSTQEKDTTNALTVPPATDIARKSKSDIFENTGELCSENSSGSKHRDQSEYHWSLRKAFGRLVSCFVI